MEFFTPHLRPYFDIKIYDRKGKILEIEALEVQPVNLKKAASCDFVLLGYPAGAIGGLCQEIAPYLSETSVVFDICSVQTPAVEAMKIYLPKCNIVTIHPIF